MVSGSKMIGGVGLSGASERLDDRAKHYRSIFHFFQEHSLFHKQRPVHHVHAAAKSSSERGVLAKKSKKNTTCLWRRDEVYILENNPRTLCVFI